LRARGRCPVAAAPSARRGARNSGRRSRARAGTTQELVGGGAARTIAIRGALEYRPSSPSLPLLLPVPLLHESTRSRAPSPACRSRGNALLRVPARLADSGAMRARRARAQRARARPRACASVPAAAALHASEASSSTRWRVPRAPCLLMNADVRRSSRWMGGMRTMRFESVSSATTTVCAPRADRFPRIAFQPSIIFSALHGVFLLRNRRTQAPERSRGRVSSPIKMTYGALSRTYRAPAFRSVETSAHRSGLPRHFPARQTRGGRYVLRTLAICSHCAINVFKTRSSKFVAAVIGRSNSQAHGAKKRAWFPQAYVAGGETGVNRGR
jgi:hypothetical protein